LKLFAAAVDVSEVFSQDIKPALRVKPNILQDEFVEIVGKGLEMRGGEGIMMGSLLQRDQFCHFPELHKPEHLLLFAVDGIIQLLELLQLVRLGVHVGDGLGWALWVRNWVPFLRVRR
jgi:hypothetical protein